MEKRFLLFLALIIFVSGTAPGGDPKYPVNTIPETLLKDANAVFREDKGVFTIHSKSKATYYVRQVITILNEKGKRYGTEVVGYDKLTKIKNLSGAVYDANGKLIKRLKSSEIQDQSVYEGFGSYSDNRMKILDLRQGSYPYTVEWEYETEYKYLFFIPTWILVPGQNISVEHSFYSLQYSSELEPRYKTFNIKAEPKIEKLENGIEARTWTFENLAAIKAEPHGPPFHELTGLISAAPSIFEYENYSGTMNSWDQFGQWISTLNRGRNQLPEPTKQIVKQLTAGLTQREEKVKAIYEYMQNRTRYVSIQFGIGGHQPFEASVVDQVGYGDCKALSNYMVSMLEVVGIPSHYALIMAGENALPMETDFPSSQFNHAIVAVPNDKDTLWLECTSQTAPFGYMGSFTGDRKALLITDKGAKVVNTIHHTVDQNLQQRNASVYLDLTGNATAKVLTRYSGLQYENDNLQFVINNQHDEQKKWLQNHIEIPSFDLVSFSMKNHKSKIPTAEVEADLSLSRYATVSGKRIFFAPNLMNRISQIPEKIESRKTPVVRHMAYTDIDTITYHLPEGIYPEFLPAPVKLETRFGKYEASYTIDQGNLVYVRRVVMNKGRFPAESYGEFVDFFKNINKADNAKLVFMNKT